MPLMRYNTKQLGIKAVTIFSALVFVLGAALESFALTCDVNPSDVGIGISYHGAKIVVSGKNNPGDDLIVKITAPEGESHLKFKGKAANLFWMKMGSMTYSEVPSLYMLASSFPVDKLLPADQLNANLIGYPALAGHVKIESDKIEVDAKQWFNEFIRFKEKDNLYSTREGMVSKPSGTEYKLELDWPYQAAPGEYQVEVLAVKNGRISERAQGKITVARAGMVDQLSNLAFNNAALYGIIAIVVALVSGFGVAAIFKGDGGSH